MESTALTFNLKGEPYSNPGAAAGHICLHSGRHRAARTVRARGPPRL